ncbi:hypothetical protein GCM10028820_04260 [Tessaracoccus terricola]
MKKVDVPPELRSLIRIQNGVFTPAQALEHGVTRAVLDRLAREGHWQSLTRGLWSVVEEPGWLGLAWGGLLLAGEGAVLGGAAAAHLWGAARQPRTIKVWTPRRLKGHPALGSLRLGHATRTRAPETQPPRLSLADAVVEMCMDATVDDVVGHVSRAVKSRNTTTAQLREALGATRNHPNRLLLADIAHDHDSGTESPIERRYLHDVALAHGLPVGTRQAEASRRGFTDVGYEEYGVLVELDGRAFHEGLAAHDDMARDNGNLLNGNRTFRYGMRAVAGTPCRVAGEVGTGLRQGGWRGQRHSCPRCG